MRDAGAYILAMIQEYSSNQVQSVILDLQSYWSVSF